MLVFPTIKKKLKVRIEWTLVWPFFRGKLFLNFLPKNKNLKLFGRSIKWNF